AVGYGNSIVTFSRFICNIVLLQAFCCVKLYKSLLKLALCGIFKFYIARVGSRNLRKVPPELRSNRAVL
ncbi:hypothetical protein OFC55_24565, partial [Escherichia coli]|nr:hypothetical protein [Escherichia coli]